MHYKRITESDLILPALKIIKEAGWKGIQTSGLIPALRKLLLLSQEDTEILQWRKDDKFSQKVRNLVSHRTLEGKWYVVFQDWSFVLTQGWENYLQTHNNELQKVLEKWEILDAYDSPIQGYFSIFNESLSNIEKLLNIEVEESLRNSYMNMLYSSVITILETYLYDALKFHVFNQPDDLLLRKFIETYQKYQEEQFLYKKLYELFEHKEEKVNETIDFMSYHRLRDISSLYKSIFWIECEEEKIWKIEKAIYKRHDLVHRNGKKKNGTVHEIEKSDVEWLMIVVKDFISYVERGIQDYLSNLVS